AGAAELRSRLPGLDVLADETAARATKRSVEAPAVAGRGEEAIADWLRSIGAHVTRRDGHVVAISLASSSVTDRELTVLGELPRLEDLSLRNTEVSDAGIAHVAKLRELRALDVSHTLLADSALAALSPLTKLQRLDLSHTLVEGAGLSALANLGALREIALA